MSSSPKPFIIDGDNVECSAWRPPSVQALTEKDRAQQKAQQRVTAESIEVLQKQAFEEGYAEGFKKGLHDGEKTVQQQILQLKEIVNLLQKPLDELDEAVTEQLTQLSISIAKMLIRRELKTDPGQIIAVVKETISALPIGIQNIRIAMNPEDATLLREAMSLSMGEQPWEIIEDPILSRGGCKVLTDSSEIDASVESRLANIIARMLGGERHSDGDAKE